MPQYELLIILIFQLTYRFVSSLGIKFHLLKKQLNCS